jgi:hypothetical protein
MEIKFHGCGVLGVDQESEVGLLGAQHPGCGVAEE